MHAASDNVMFLTVRSQGIIYLKFTFFLAVHSQKHHIITSQ